MEQQKTVIGIDLGTTQSCVSVWQDDHVQIIPNDLGNTKTPSVVAFTNTGSFVGDAAKNQIEKNRENTIYDAKRIIGKHFKDRELQKQLPLYPFKVINNEGKPQFEVNFKGEIKRFAPEEILSMTLAKLKKDAESHLGQKVTDAVIAVPASFNSCQRQAVKDAGAIAGLNVMTLINEPTAAALTYAMHNNPEYYSNVLVLDVGGGFCGLTILNIRRNSFFETKLTCGTSSLRGKDIDDILVKHFSQEFERKFGKDLKSNFKALNQLRMSCERVKQSLSSNSVVAFEIKSLHEGIDFTSKITRTTFESLCTTLFQDILNFVKNALRRVNLDKSKIKDIIFVGGSSRIPKIQELLQEFFDGKKLNMLLPNDAAVAHGAALQAAIISKNAGERIQDALLIDVTYFSLEVKEEEEGITRLIIMRSTNVPTKQTYSLQIHSKIIEIYEGEKLSAKDNHFLGTLDLTGIVPPSEGFPRKIELTFFIRIQTDFDLNVVAKDVWSKKSELMSISYNKSGLTKEELKEMTKKAEDYVEDDKKQVETDKARIRLKDEVF